MLIILKTVKYDGAVIMKVCIGVLKKIFGARKYPNGSLNTGQDEFMLVI